MRGTTPPNWQITTRRASDPGRNAQGTGCEGYAAWPYRARVTSSSVALRAPILQALAGRGMPGPTEAANSKSERIGGMRWRSRR